MKIYQQSITWIYLFMVLGLVSIMYLSLIDKIKTDKNIYKGRRVRQYYVSKNILVMGGLTLTAMWAFFITFCIVDFKLF